MIAFEWAAGSTEGHSQYTLRFDVAFDGIGVHVDMGEA